MKMPRLIASAAVAGIVAVSAAACGSSSGGTTAAPAAAATPVAAIANVTAVDTAVGVEPSVLTALTGLGVKVTPVGTGKLTNTYGPTLDFPITGGNVKIYDKTKVTPYVQGLIEHNGSGIEFSAGSKTLTVENFDINPGTSILTATVKELNNARVPLFILDGSNLQITKDAAGHAKLDGTKVELTQTAADALNKTFGVTAFSAKMLIGTAHITAG